MILRLMNADRLGEYLSGTDAPPQADDFDAADWIADTRNVVLVEGESMALFGGCGGDVYEAHWLFRCRGRAALDLGAAMLGEMFANYGARAVKGMIPIRNRKSRWFTRQLGCVSLGIVETVRGPEEIFMLRADQWAA